VEDKADHSTRTEPFKPPELGCPAIADARSLSDIARLHSLPPAPRWASVNPGATTEGCGSANHGPTNGVYRNT